MLDGPTVHLDIDDFYGVVVITAAVDGGELWETVNLKRILHRDSQLVRSDTK
jgi:hypothetical protein